MQVIHTIKSLQQKVALIQAQEMQKSSRKLRHLPGPKRAVVQRAIEHLVASVADQILRDPIVRLRRQDTDGDGRTPDQLAEAVRVLFNLSGPATRECLGTDSKRQDSEQVASDARHYAKQQRVAEGGR